MASVSFRFLQLNKLQLLTLKRDIPELVATELEAPHHYCVSVPLEAHHIDTINMFFVRQQLILEQVDILVCLDTSDCGTEYSAPRLLNQMLKHLDCTLRFTCA
ncbi:hypothetical protein ACFOEE_10080 [Pseudoalteromonas fenneropenaei]|uniref:Uncharacterized protein n=1 Tax=Pseudoalteromonas fenneropenaei TaxID=1737459 RepID=A0ABV7CJS7_9GAMM